MLEAIEKGYINQVEPHTTSLMYLMGREIYLSKGNQLNFKITTKEDLELFKGFVLMKNQEKLKNSKVVTPFIVQFIVLFIFNYLILYLVL